jgi:hypothetical protein
MHMTGKNNTKDTHDSKSFLFQGRPWQVFGEPSAPTSATAKVYSVGDVGPGGGIVFYVHPSGTFTSIGSDGGLNCKYLEAAPADLEGEFEDEFEWCSNTDSSLGVTATGIGAGMANTTTAANTCTSSAKKWKSAIQLAANYVNNGKTDWHLPSKDELNELYKYASSVPSGDARRKLRPGFSAVFYWSSSEAAAYTAWGQFFFNGSQSRNPKSITYRVRLVRAF